MSVFFGPRPPNHLELNAAVNHRMTPVLNLNSDVPQVALLAGLSTHTHTHTHRAAYTQARLNAHNGYSMYITTIINSIIRFTNKPE